MQGIDTGINLGEVIRAVSSTQSSQPSLFPSLAVPLVRSLLAIAEVDPQFMLDEAKLVFQVFKKAIRLLPEAQAPGFDVCKFLVERDGAKFVSHRVFPLLINLLTDFATLGSVGAEWEQRNDVLQKRLKPSTKAPDKPYFEWLKSADCRYADQIARAKSAVDLIFSLHQRAKSLISESEDPATGTFQFAESQLTTSLGTLLLSSSRISNSSVN